MAWVLLIPTVEGKSTMLKISVTDGRTQPRDPERQANRVPGRGANDHVKGGQEKGQRARCYAYVKTTWTLRIVFLLWSVISIALMLGLNCPRLYHSQTGCMGMKNENSELRIDSIKLTMR